MTVLRKLTKAIFSKNPNYWKYTSRQLFAISSTAVSFIRPMTLKSLSLGLYRLMNRICLAVQAAEKLNFDLQERDRERYGYR